MNRKLEPRRMTEHQAYRAMLKFLERRFEEIDSDELGALLGSASLVEDGDSADPAMRGEWAECVSAVLAADEGKQAAE
jgi:hypothetical protein